VGSAEENQPELINHWQQAMQQSRQPHTNSRKIKFHNNYIKCQIPNTSIPKREQEAAGLHIKQLFLRWLQTRLQDNRTFITAHTGLKENFTTKEK
jgi:hypothetical protein